MAVQSIARPRQRVGKIHKPMKYPLAAGVLIKEGTVVVLDAGYAKEGVTAASLIAVGIADETVDNTAGGAGAKSITVHEGDFPVDNSSAGDLLAQADVGAVAYLVDNNTYAKTNGSSTRSAPARLVGFFSDGRPVMRFEQLAK